MSAPGWSYNTVDVSFWDDEKVRAFSEDGRTLAIYLLTCSHRTAEGFYRLPATVAIDDLSWTRKRWDVALAELVKMDFADYDQAARLVLVIKGLKYHPPIHGPKSIKGALNVLDKAKGSPRLFGKFLAAADKYEPDFAAGIRHHYDLPDGPYEGASDGAS
jgi:hypothetical protein